MLATAFTKLVGCARPLQLAGMPGVVTPALARAVAGAGGLAMLPSAGVPAALLARDIEDLARTGAPIGVNFLIPFLDDDCLREASRRVKRAATCSSRRESKPEAMCVARSVRWRCSARGRKTPC